jgi:hypothetical protein
MTRKFITLSLLIVSFTLSAQVSKPTSEQIFNFEKAAIFTVYHKDSDEFATLGNIYDQLLFLENEGNFNDNFEYKDIVKYDMKSKVILDISKNQLRTFIEINGKLDDYETYVISGESYLNGSLHLFCEYTKAANGGVFQYLNSLIIIHDIEDPLKRSIFIHNQKGYKHLYFSN